MRQEQLFLFPSRELAAVFARWFLTVFAAYAVIYYPCNLYASSQPDLYHMYAQWELAIPLVPQMLLIYTSYVLVFIVLLFVLKTSDAVRGLGYAMLAMTIISGFIFVLFPGQLGFQRTAQAPGYGWMFSLLFQIDRPHNLFPSLHVSYAYLCIVAMMHQTRQRWFHLALKIWFGAVCASVVLVHQHHLFDIASGTILSWAFYKAIYLKIAEKGKASVAHAKR